METIKQSIVIITKSNTVSYINTKPFYKYEILDNFIVLEDVTIFNMSTRETNSVNMVLLPIDTISSITITDK